MNDLFPAEPDKENAIEVANSLSSHAGVRLKHIVDLNLLWTCIVHLIKEVLGQEFVEN